MSIKIPSIRIPARPKTKVATVSRKRRESQWPGGFNSAWEVNLRFPKSRHQSILYHVSRLGTLGS